VGLSQNGDRYIGRTILELKMAYKDARLITGPDSHWLTPQICGFGKDNVSTSSSNNGVLTPPHFSDDDDNMDADVMTLLDHEIEHLNEHDYEEEEEEQELQTTEENGSFPKSHSLENLNLGTHFSNFSDNNVVNGNTTENLMIDPMMAFQTNFYSQPKSINSTNNRINSLNNSNNNRGRAFGQITPSAPSPSPANAFNNLYSANLNPNQFLIPILPTPNNTTTVNNNARAPAKSNRLVSSLAVGSSRGMCKYGFRCTRPDCWYQHPSN